MEDDNENQSQAFGDDLNLKTGNITKVVEDSFLRYSMSVIVARALPDARDGLKPVHRRILYTMHRNGIRSNSKTVKSAKVTGDVMGKYHPHGNTAIYEAMARLAVDWSTRYPLILGQGNFGNMDGDPPAAERYTEVKLSKNAEALLEDLDKETVDFRPNYDGTESEPEVLPAKLPNLILNGQLGIAVGMATNIPPHNLGEVVDASLHLIDNPDCQISDILKIIKGPDFPTGGIVYRGDSMKEAYASGRGSIVLRAKVEIEERVKKDSHRLVVTEVPYNTNIANIIERVADLVRDKKITTISDIRDESSRGKIRIVIDLKKDAYPKNVLNQIYQLTALQTSFSYNMVALIDGIQPRILNILDILREHLQHRQKVVRRRTEFELKKAQARAHILEGLTIALDNIDKVIAIIRSSDTTDNAKKSLIKNFKLTEIQANAILAMQLRSLAGLERKKIEDELKDLNKLIKSLKELLGDEKKILDVIRLEFQDLKEKFADARRTQIVRSDFDKFSEEDLIPNERVVVTLTRADYIKRSLESSYKKQGRGGKGRKGVQTKESDVVQSITVASTHDDLLFFTNQGRVFKLKCYEVPAVNLNSKGTAIVNLLQLRSDETISSVLKIPKSVDENYNLFMCTRFGVVKKSPYKLYKNLRQNGLITINLDKGDELKRVRFSNGSNEVIISTAQGQANRFSETDVRPMGRTARGVRGIRLRKDDYVVGMDIAVEGESLFMVSANGYGKRTKVEQFTTHKRGGVGVRSAIVNDKTGELILVRCLKSYNKKDEIIAISKKGRTIRFGLHRVPLLQRVTQGVRVMRLNKDDKVVWAVVLKYELEASDDEDGAKKPDQKAKKK